MNKNILWVIFWLALAFVATALIWVFISPDKASQFISCYMLEKSLSFDNLFVINLIFGKFGVPRSEQGKYLSWGIWGAFIFRAIFIGGGLTLVSHFHEYMMVFGTILFIGAKKVWTEISNKRKGIEGEDDDPIMFTKIGPWVLPLAFSIILTVELVDIFFAFDSIPASLAVSQDLPIVYGANVLAVCGLRSLYFVLLDWLDKFENLEYGVCIVLFLISAKILLAPIYVIPNAVSLTLVVLILIGSALSGFVGKESEKDEFI